MDGVYYGCILLYSSKHSLQQHMVDSFMVLNGLPQNLHIFSNFSTFWRLAAQDFEQNIPLPRAISDGYMVMMLLQYSQIRVRMD